MKTIAECETGTEKFHPNQRISAAEVQPCSGSGKQQTSTIINRIFVSYQNYIYKYIIYKWLSKVELKATINCEIPIKQTFLFSDLLQPVVFQPKTTDESKQVSICRYFRIRSPQTITKIRNIAVSPKKNLTASISTSVFKLEVTRKSKPSISAAIKTAKRVCFNNKEEQSDSYL